MRALRRISGNWCVRSNCRASPAKTGGSVEHQRAFGRKRRFGAVRDYAAAALKPSTQPSHASHERTATEAIFRAGPLTQKLKAMHARLRQQHPAVDRVSFIHYDAKTDQLTTFVDSTEAGRPLLSYQCALATVPSLAALVHEPRIRIINDIASELQGERPHSAYLNEQGYRSSLTFPVVAHGRLLGFVFFDSRQLAAFADPANGELDVFGQLISLMLTEELLTIEMLANSIELARDFARLRDVETAAHLDRTARFAQLIARQVAPLRGFDDEFVEYVFLFAPLHDIGKVGIPDSILLKPGRLDEFERETMNTHVLLGTQMIDRLIVHFNLGDLPNLQMLRNIVGAHHERLDGTGYPNGLSAAQIPLEARIVATADIFDALTNPRSYKQPWSVDDSYTELLRLVPNWLDEQCVASLLAHRREVEDIIGRFPERA
jgi:HD-GYP domain-containing protein (c-di-GMP phosphodiesterase class II)